MEHISVYTEKKARQLTKGPKFVRWAVMLGIVILLNVFFLVARGVLFPQPQYQDYCPVHNQATYDQTSCVKTGGEWIPDGSTAAGVPSAPPPASVRPALQAKIPTGYCDYATKCQKPFQAAQVDYDTKSFIFLIGLGVLALIIGVLPLGSSIVSTGLSYGGVLAFVIGSITYWHDAPQFVQLGISAIGLGALIYIGLKRFHD